MRAPFVRSAGATAAPDAGVRSPGERRSDDGRGPGPGGEPEIGAAGGVGGGRGMRADREIGDLDLDADPHALRGVRHGPPQPAELPVGARDARGLERVVEARGSRIPVEEGDVEQRHPAAPAQQEEAEEQRLGAKEPASGHEGQYTTELPASRSPGGGTRAGGPGREAATRARGAGAWARYAGTTGQALSVSRTVRTTASGVNGFWMNTAFDSTSPRRTMSLSVYPEVNTTGSPGTSS